MNKKTPQSFWRENIRISIRSIKSNLLRSTLTILIIGIGIMALIGILTAIEAIKGSINNEFTRLGANTFTIQNRNTKIQLGRKRFNAVKTFAQITYYQAKDFKESFEFPALVSLSQKASMAASVRYQSKKTNPNIMVNGGDENNLQSTGHEIEKGRNFNLGDIKNNKTYTIIGSEVASFLFDRQTNPIGKNIYIGNNQFTVVGVLKEKGSSGAFNEDKMVLIPISQARIAFPSNDASCVIHIMPNSADLMDAALAEAEGRFRIIRKLELKDGNDFEINKSDNLVEMLLDNLKYVTVAATVIGFITLFGAAIGLMNIMLVAVAERTREIGVRKAMGATSKIIFNQFLYESIIIGQIGGIVGIILGIVIGNLVSVLIGSSFVIPWLWVVGGVGLCLAVGVLSGILPAMKASKLDPIDALRYE